MQLDTAAQREGEQLLCVLGDSLPAPVGMAGTALWATGARPQLLLWDPSVATCCKGRWEKEMLSSSVQIPSISFMEEKLL